MTNIIQEETEHHSTGNPLNEYQVLEKNFLGSTAKVYKVRNSQGKVFCLKIYYIDEEIFPGDTSLKESHLLNVDIPSLTKVYKVDSFFEDNKTVHYSLMEYIDGIPLYEFIKINNYDSSFVKDLADRLYHANNLLLDKKLAHRDITTSNILITEQKECYLIDFGMITRTDTNELTELEQSFWNDELKEILGSTLALDTTDLPKFWRVITLFEIRRVMHDVIVKKSKPSYKDIMIFIGLDYEIRLLASNGKKLMSTLYTLKEFFKLSRRMLFKMTYFKK